MPFELGDLINKAMSKAELILSATRGTVDLNDSLREADNFIRLVNVIVKQASLNQQNRKLFQARHSEICAVYDKITLYLLQERQSLNKELKIHHKNQEAIKSYSGGI